MRRLLIALALVAACGGKQTTGTTTTTTTDPTTNTVTEPPKFDWAKYPRVDILDYYGLASSSYMPLRQYANIQKTLGEAGVPEAEVETVLAGAEEPGWPQPFTESQRWNNNNVIEIGLIRSRQVAYLPNDQVLVVALAGENQHLKPGARPEKDFFLIFQQTSLKPIDPVPERPKAAEGAVDYSQYAQATIVDPGQLVSTPGLRYIENIQTTLLNAGIPQAELENVYTRVEESGWPYYFSTFDQRINNPDIIRQFVVRRVATVQQGMVMVIIPAAENQHMPEGWRPDVDIYATFLEQGLK